MMEKPDLDHIEGLSPAISIEQKAASHNPRSTVGTVTEVHDYLRLMFARVGTPRCPEHGETLDAQTVSQMVDTTLNLPKGSRLMLLAPVVRERKGEHQNLFRDLRAQGFVRVRINGTVHDLDGELPALGLRRKHSIEGVVDRFRAREDMAQRLAESFETALAIADGVAIVAPMDADSGIQELLFSARFACPVCDYSLPELEPRMFSFNNPSGACPACDGLGRKQFFDPERVVGNAELSLAGGAIRGWDRRNAYYFQMVQSLARHYDFDPEAPFSTLPNEVREVILHGSGDEKISFRYFGDGGTQARKHPFVGIIPNLERRYRETDSRIVREELARYISEQPCPACNGQRLNPASRNVFIGGQSLPEISSWSIERCLGFFDELELPGWRGEIAGRILKEVRERLGFLVNVGLDYLTLDRQADTLSGGEAQRIRLASQIGAGLVGVMYVLDEPSIGLHQRDNARLLETLIRLRDLGNTVIVVEHDEEAIRAADYIVDIGPGPGVHGGRIVYSGVPAGIIDCKESLTGDYLSGRKAIELPAKRVRPSNKRTFRIQGASGNNLQSVDLEIPAGLFVCVTGVSGSGKSTLVNDTLYRLMARELNGASEHPAPFESFSGIELFDKVVDIDQSPIGRTPRSNPATYTGLFTPIRELFAGTREARSRGYKPGRFSFNVKGGRCEACSGGGVTRVSMLFLPDVYVPCEVCGGKRYNHETLEVKFKGKSIADVLEMTVEEALNFFRDIPRISSKLALIAEAGMGYIRLGQSALTLSGGEAQRVKLSKELSKRFAGPTLYLLDEPTTGLFYTDVAKLLNIIGKIVDNGNTVILIEHNLDVLLSCDYIIDLGPEGGNGGGKLVATGTPEEIIAAGKGYTARFLRKYAQEIAERMKNGGEKNEQIPGKEQQEQQEQRKRRRKTGVQEEHSAASGRKPRKKE